MARSGTVNRFGFKQLFLLLIVVLAFYVLLPQLSIFHAGFAFLLKARLDKLLVAALFTFATFLIAALTYCLLAIKRIPYGHTVAIQFAGMFTNRLLPAGLGGIGINYAYLKKQHHNVSQAASVVTANNILGFIGHLLLFGVAFCFSRAPLPAFTLDSYRFFHSAWLVLFGCCAVFALLLMLHHYYKRLVRNVRRMVYQLLSYGRRPEKLTAALLTSISLTLCNVLSLYFCVVAFNMHLSLIAVLIIFTLGVALGTATPTPGGLGGTEAGLIAGLVAYHVDATEALAIALVYRLISFWLTLAVGAGFFVVAERKTYF